MKIENIKPDGYVMKGVYTPAKKIDLGDSYLIFVSGVQAPAGEVNEVVTLRKKLFLSAHFFNFY